MAASGPTLSAVVPPVGPRSCTGSVAPQGFLKTISTTRSMRLDEFGRGDYYVSSEVGNDAYSGVDWDAAKGTLRAAVAAGRVLGSHFFLDMEHDEFTNPGATVTYTFPGNLLEPTRVICVVRDDTYPPQTRALGARVQINSTGNSWDQYFDGFVYVFGVRVLTATGNINSIIRIGSGLPNVRQKWESCRFYVMATGGSTGVQFGTGTANTEGPNIHLKNVDLYFISTVHWIYGVQCVVEWEGGAILAGSATPPSPWGNLGSSGRLSVWNISGVDFSNFASTFTFATDVAGTNLRRMTIRNCKLPSGWTGTPFAGVMSAQGFVYLDNCDDGNTNHMMWRELPHGSIKSETTIVRTGGSSDGTTPLSWMMWNNPSSTFPNALTSPERAQWNEIVGSTLTVTVEICHDSQGSGTGGRFTNQEVWLEVMALQSTGTLGAWASDGDFNHLVAGTDQSDSTETWTTIGMSTPIKQKLSVDILPMKVGHIIYRVVFRAPNKTCYADPVATVTVT